MKLYELLSNELNVCYLNGSRSHIVVRCPYCGDSMRSPHKGHLYISLEPPHPYMCQKCGDSGVFDRQTLDFFRIQSLEMYTYVSEIEIHQRKQPRIATRTRDHKLNIDTRPREPSIWRSKCEYLERRIQCSREYTNYLRVIPGLWELFESNPELKIDLSTLKFGKHDRRSVQQRVMDLDRNYIGFINHDHSVLVFRAITDQPMRYRKLLIKHDDHDSYFVFGGSYDVLSDPRINIAEGIITTAGAQLYTQRFQDVWIAGNSKSGITHALKWPARYGFVNGNVVFWADRDVDINFYERLTNVPVCKSARSICVVRNRDHSDFGTTRDRIDPEYLFLKGTELK